MRKIFLRNVAVILCAILASCNMQPNAETVAKNAIKDAEQSVNKLMMQEDEPEGPFFLRYRYPLLIKQQSMAINKAYDSIDEDMGTDKETRKERYSYDEKRCQTIEAKMHIADSIKRVAGDYIQNYYRQPIEDAIAEINGVEFPCFYNSDYVQSAQAFVKRNPNDIYEYAVRLQIDMTLKQPSLNHTVFFIEDGVPSTPGYGNIRAERFFRIDGERTYLYDPGTRVRFFVSLPYNELITIKSLYIQECKYM